MPTVPSRTYVVSADVKVDAADGHVPSSVFLTAKAMNPDGSQNQGATTQLTTGALTDGEGWQRRTFTFTAVNWNTFVGTAKWAAQDAEGHVANTTIAMDNLTVFEEQTYDLVWNDEFDGESLDQDAWGYELGNVRGNEQQPYSADFHMDGLVNMQQGYSWPGTGELDIMEIIGAPTEERAAQGEVGKAGNSNSTAYGTPHFYCSAAAGQDGSYAPTALGGSVTAPESLSEGYHVDGIDWNPDYIAWHIDGVVYNVMYFPTDATETAGNRAFIGDEVARFQAAADCLNRPQYLQLNLATGGNWAGDAGDHLAEDGAALEVDWVRYYRSDSQQLAADAYYADQPALDGVEDRVMRAGEAADLLAGVTTSDGYLVDYSINDESMFVNGGAEGGRNEVSLRVKDSQDTAALQSLAPGVYSLHHSALEDGATYSGAITPEARVVRRTVHLTVLPAEGLHGTSGGTLADVALPEGWSWADPAQALGGEETSYSAVFTQAADAVTAPEERRQVRIEIPAEQIALDAGDGSDGEEGDGPGKGNGNGKVHGKGNGPDTGNAVGHDRGEAAGLDNGRSLGHSQGRDPGDVTGGDAGES